MLRLGEETVNTNEAEQLLKEAIRIIHTNLRNTHKDWLTRARNHVQHVERQKADQREESIRKALVKRATMLDQDRK